MIRFFFFCVVRIQDQGADGDGDNAAANGEQAKCLSNGDFHFPVLIPLDQLCFKNPMMNISRQIYARGYL